MHPSCGRRAEMGSSLIILVSLLGNCSAKKETRTDQFGLHCSITQIRERQPGQQGWAVSSADSVINSSHHYTDTFSAASYTPPPHAIIITITTWIAAKWLYPPHRFDTMIARNHHL